MCFLFFLYLRTHLQRVAPSLERIHVLGAHAPVAAYTSHPEVVQRRLAAALVGENVPAIPRPDRNEIVAAAALAHVGFATVTLPNRLTDLLRHVGASHRARRRRVDACNLSNNVLEVLLALLRLPVLPNLPLLRRPLGAHCTHVGCNDLRQIIVHVEKRGEQSEEQGVGQLGASGHCREKGEEPSQRGGERIVLLRRCVEQRIVLLHHRRDLGILRQKGINPLLLPCLLNKEKADQPVQPELLGLLLQIELKDRLRRLLQPLLLAEELDERNVNSVLVKIRATDGHALLQGEKDVAALIERQLILDLSDVEEKGVELLLLLLSHVRMRQLRLCRPLLRVLVLSIEHMSYMIVLLVTQGNHKALLPSDVNGQAVEEVVEREEAVLAIHTLVLEVGLRLLVISLQLIEQQPWDEPIMHDRVHEITHVLLRPGDAPLVNGVKVDLTAHRCHDVLNLLGHAHRSVGQERNVGANRHSKERKEEREKETGDKSKKGKN